MLTPQPFNSGFPVRSSASVNADDVKTEVKHNNVVLATMVRELRPR